MSQSAQNDSIETKETKEQQFTEEEKKKMRLELQRQFNHVKKKLKVRSKSELIAMLWEQGMEYKRLQNIAQELYEENKAYKEAQNAKENSKETN